MNPKLVYKLLEKIPLGRVSTYGEIGRALNMSPRSVGRILHQNPDPKKYPCHRIVKSDGSIASGFAFGGSAGQEFCLQKEGIKIVNCRIKNFRDIFIAL